MFEKRVAGRKLSAAEQTQKHRLVEEIGHAVVRIPRRAGSVPSSTFDGLMQVPTISVLGPERPELVKPVHRLERGELDQPRERVEPAIPEVLAVTTGRKAP